MRFGSSATEGAMCSRVREAITDSGFEKLGGIVVPDVSSRGWRRQIAEASEEKFSATIRGAAKEIVERMHPHHGLLSI
jgi:hypothetical protein